jgi:phenylpyruvate tautomerase PptA (4-oxalocrotonate tautomerase family)
MAQVKIYGLRSSLAQKRDILSKAIHESLMEVFDLPETKRFHRYMLLDEEEFTYPSDRSDQYTIIELLIFEGRSVKAKKQLINLLFSNLKAQASLEVQDVEITLFETPLSNWGIRGLPSDELALNYEIKV